MCLSREAVQAQKLAEKLMSFGWSPSNAYFYANRYYRRRLDARSLTVRRLAEGTAQGTFELRASSGRCDDASLSPSASES